MNRDHPSLHSITTTTSTVPPPTAALPERYDVVIVGARAAGAATAMLLARQGLRVLVVDRSRYGADTLSTHALMRTGVLALSHWGLLDRVRETTPMVQRTVFHYAHDAVSVSIKPAAEVDGFYAPRRTVLDPMLVDAARAAGADVRFGVSVDGVIRNRSGRVVGVTGQDRSGRQLNVRARFTIGADGIHSVVARSVDAPVERRGASGGVVSYGYWSGVVAEGYEWYWRPGFTAGLIPTGNGEVCAFVGSPAGQRGQGSPGTRFERRVAQFAPDLRERLADGDRSSSFRGFSGLSGYLRRPVGPGWALVGDAGYYKDPLSAHGITDALRDAELLSRAILAASAGQPEGLALREYQATRDRLSLRLFTVVNRIASYAWDDTSIRGLLRELSAAMTDEMEAFELLQRTTAGGAAS